jgi:hypothetical protein
VAHSQVKPRPAVFLVGFDGFREGLDRFLILKFDAFFDLGFGLGENGDRRKQ